MSTIRLSVDSDQRIVISLALRDRMDAVETHMATAFRAIQRKDRCSTWVNTLDDFTQELRQLYVLQKRLLPGRYPRVARARQAS